MLAAGAGCLAAATVVYVVAVRTFTGQAVENVAMDGHPEDKWWRVRPVADRMGIVASLLVAAGVVAVVTWAWRRGSWQRALAVAASIATSAALAEALKLWVLTRPGLVAVGERAYLAPNTFPSGHTAAVVAVALAAVALAPPARRLPVALAGGAYAALVELVLLGGEAHRPADAVGAALVSTAVGLGAIALVTSWACGPDAPESPEPGALTGQAGRTGPLVSTAGTPGRVALAVEAPGADRRDGRGRPDRSAIAVLAAAGTLAVLALVVAAWVVALAVADGPLTTLDVDAARVLGGVMVAVVSLASALGFAWLIRDVRLPT
jgi:hypothetical protein